MNKRIVIASLFVAFGLFAAFELFVGSSTTKAAEGKILVVQLKGTATGQTRPVPPIAATSTSTGNCFDVTLVNVQTDEVIGTATDCLSDVVPVGLGLALTGTTFFNFEDGTIVSRGHTTVQPITTGASPTTHITGAIPFPNTNQILQGTGEFEGRTGTVRLSGAVNVSNFANNEITFDCIFVIHLNP